MSSESNPVESATCARVGEAQRAKNGIRLAPAIILGLLGGALLGCGQKKDAPALPRDLSQETPKPKLSDKSVLAPVPATKKLLPESRLPVYELKMTAKDLVALEQTAFQNDTHPAIFIANGVTYNKVKVRFRGDWARTWPKKPLKIFFDHDQLFEGRRCLNLNSGWRDPAFIREPLAFQFYAACGVPAPKARMVRLHVNGQFRGLYVEVEQPDKAFLSRLNLKGASLYKAISKSHQSDERDLGAESNYGSHYDKETQKTEGQGDLESFCHDLARATNVAGFFNDRMDLDKYINYLAATVLIQNWDCFNKNHFLLYEGRNSKKWWVVPWDLDRTFGDHWHGGFDYAQLPILLGTRPLPGPTGWNRMEARFFSDPALRGRLLDRLQALLEKEFTTEKLFPILDGFEADISAEAALDRARWPSPTPDLHSGIAQVKNYIKRRRAFLMGEVARLREGEGDR